MSRWSGRRKTAHADALAQHLAVAQPEHAHHPTGVDRLRRADRNALPAQGLDELHQVARDSVGGQRLRRTGAADGHQFEPQLPGRLDLVGLMLEHDPQGGGDQLVVDGVQTQRQNRAPPVDRLGDRRQLLELHAAQHADDAHEFLGQVLGQFRHPRQQDPALQVGVGEVDVQEQAPALERLGQLAGGVRCQQHERCAFGGDRAEFRHGDREVGQHLEQQAFDLDVGLVRLVDEQDGRLGRRIAVSNGRDSRNSSENTSVFV